MEINILHLLEGAKQAKGLTVIIDVFRAFSTACYVAANHATRIVPVGNIETAYQLKKENPDFLLIGERGGQIQPGFDYGNSPTQIECVDFTDKTVIHTTSAGTQGIVSAIHADEIITGSFVNAKAIIDYILMKNPAVVSLVCMGWEASEPADEDTFCATYIKNALEGKPNNFPEIVRYMREESTTGKFLDVVSGASAPAGDFENCLRLNKFNFILKAEKLEGGLLHFRKVDLPANPSNTNRRVLIIGADGMRPDSVDPELMPTYAKLIKQGTLFTQFFADYPPHTRVSMTTLTTGVHSGRHGVVNNHMYIPGFQEDGFVQTGNDKHLLAFKHMTGEPIILCPTLGDRLQQQGKRLSVAASSSPGAALLWNINHPEQIVNPSSHYGQPALMALHNKLGEVPVEQGSTKLERAKWATRALIDAHLEDQSNQVMVLWLSEPDASQHDYGLGSPEAKEGLRVVDHCVAEVLQALDRLGLRDEINLLLISDHGHSTVNAQGSLEQYLDKACRELALTSRFMTTGDFIYAHPDDELNLEELNRLVKWLCNQEWCDIVFTSFAIEADLPGVMPIETAIGPIHHNRAPLMAISPKWFDTENKFGVPGIVKSLTSSASLKATHGTWSPYDLHAFFLGCGPDFAEGKSIDALCGIVDIAPTVCHLIGLTQSAGFDGRVLIEGLKPQ